MKRKSLCPLMGILLIMFLVNCTSKKQVSRAGVPHSNLSSKVYTFNVKDKTIDNVQLPNLSLRSNEIFSVKVTNYNPFADALSVSTTASTFYIDNASPVMKYVSFDAKTESSSTKAGSAPIVNKGDNKNQIKELTKLASDVNSSQTQLQNSINYLSSFYNSLVILQSFMNDWKTGDIDQNTVNAQFGKVKTELTTNIQNFYLENPSNVDPFTSNIITGADNYPIIPSDLIIDFPSKAIIIYRENVNKYENSLSSIEQFGIDNKVAINNIYSGAGLPNANQYKSKNTNLLKVFQKFSDDYDVRIGNNLLGLGSTFSIIKNAKFEETFGPISMTKDDEMVVKISQINALTKVDKLKDFAGFTITRKGLKIDFSAGVFGSGLAEESYVSSQFTRITMDSVVKEGSIVIEPNKTTFSKIEKRKADKFSYGPMAFVHFYYKNPAFINIGAFIGTGLLFKDVAKPVFSFGGNLLFGKSQRVILGFGGSIASVTRLSSKYQIGQAYAETITEVPTENHYDIKWMTSISWNISR